MSKPPIYPEQSVAGIAVDPRTLERVIPQSKRPDGSVRKELKVRPGFTPQEDVSRFRGRRQQQMDSNALPKGHIIGWVPSASDPKPGAKPSGAGIAVGSGGKPLTKAAAKNAKRKAKRQAENSKDETVKDNWEDDDDEGDEGDTKAESAAAAAKPASTPVSGNQTPASPPKAAEPLTGASTPSEKKEPWTPKQRVKSDRSAQVRVLADALQKLDMR